MTKFFLLFAFSFPTIGSTQWNGICLTPWGDVIPHGAWVIAYELSRPPPGFTCRSEIRSCTDGQLSGSFTHRSCQEVPFGLELSEPDPR
jgi:hypothetical protein